MMSTQAGKEPAASPGTRDREKLYTLDDAAKLIPRSEKDQPIPPSTLTRWIAKGVLLKGGGRLYLEAQRLPGRWVISAEAIDKFIAELTEDRRNRNASRPNPRPKIED